MKCRNILNVVLFLVGFFICLFGNIETTLANIIADSASEFSDTQGQDNWYYGYYTTPGDS